MMLELRHYSCPFAFVVSLNYLNKLDKIAAAFDWFLK